MQMAPQVPDENPLCFSRIKSIICFAKRDISHLGLVMPSNDLFTPDGASLHSLYS